MSLIGLLTATYESAYETHSVALEKPLEGLRIYENGDSCASLTAPTSEKNVRNHQNALKMFTDVCGEGPVVGAREQVAHKLAGSQSSVVSAKRVKGDMLGAQCVDC